MLWVLKIPSQCDGAFGHPCKMFKLMDILARPDDTSSRSLAFRPLHDIWLVPLNSRTAVVTELIAKNSKKLNF